MTGYLCSNCQSSVSKTAVRCPYCGVLLSGTRNMSASEQAHIRDRAKEYQDTREKQKREKQQELDNKRYIENKKSKIDKVSSIFHNLEKEPDLFKTLLLKSAFRKLIKIFLEDENEEIKGWALASITNSLHNHLIDKKLFHSYLISIQPYLINILENPTKGARLRNTVVNSLGKIGSDQAVDAILKAIESDADIDYSDALCALINTGHSKAEETVQIVLKKDSNPKVISKVISHIGSFGGRQWIEYILPYIECPNDDVRSWTIFALGRLKEKTVVPQLMQFVTNDPSYKVRSEAAKALGEMGDIKAVKVLEQASEDTNPNVTEQASIALKRLAQVKKDL